MTNDNDLIRRGDVQAIPMLGMTVTAIEKAIAAIPAVTPAVAVKPLVDLLHEARNDLAVYVDYDWPLHLREQYPDIKKKWKRDMELCFRIDAAIALTPTPAGADTGIKPTMTDLMVDPDTIDAFMDANPLPPDPHVTETEHDAGAVKLADALAVPEVRALVEAADQDGFGALIFEAKIEAEKAMRKFPQPNYVISKIAEEAGEVVKAAIHAAEGRETIENLRGEMKQTIAMLYRLWVEGDQVHGLPPVSAALRQIGANT